MRAWTIGTVLMLLPCLGTRAQGLPDQEFTGLRAHICRCMEALDPEASASVYEQGFRACLGEAVLRHPAQVRTLLRDAPPGGSPGYRLGTALGEVMGSGCPAYLRARDQLRTLLRRGERPGGT